MKRESLRILIVDDTPENLVALEALLRRDNVEVLKARSGTEALELLLANDVALALLDVQMPGMDGFELAELMRGAERTKRVPIIFVTAGARDPNRVFKGYETGAVDFLYKPVDPIVLRSKVAVFLELADQRNALAQALELNEYFIGILGHDLRNPLSAMVAGTELLSMTADERQQRALDRMANAGRRMREMIEQMLDLTRARLGGGMGFARQRSVVDVHAVVQQIVDELRVVHPEREIRWEARPGCQVCGDPERLLQLFSNLFSNAVTHGTAGTPITVTLMECGPDIVIEVHNLGAIAPEVLPTLFEPFRGKRRTTQGLGLGLFIADQIAKAHDGEIIVDSTPETGTTLRVRLPTGELAACTGTDG